MLDGGGSSTGAVVISGGIVDVVLPTVTEPCGSVDVNWITDTDGGASGCNVVLATIIDP